MASLVSRSKGTLLRVVLYCLRRPRDHYTLALQEISGVIMRMLVSKDPPSDFGLKPIMINGRGHGSNSGTARARTTAL